MSKRRIRHVRKFIMIASTGVVFSALSCVMNAADIFGTGLSLTSDLFGPAGVPGAAIGTGLDAFADLLRFGLGAN